MALTLYHYTCNHGHSQIADTLVSTASRAPLAAGGPGEYVWLTDLATPHRHALGLTSHMLSCDRAVHRYRVTDDSGVVPWISVRRRWSWAIELESALGARPRHWFVSAAPVPVVHDPIRAAARDGT